MVRLLAGRVDPGNNRQLSFAELVGPTAPKPRASAIPQTPGNLSMNAEVLGAESDLAKADHNDNALADADARQSANLLAATQLASAVRRFQQRQSGSADETLDAKKLLGGQRKIADSSNAAALRFNKQPIASAPVEPNAASPVKKLPSASQNSFAAPAIEHNDLVTRFSSQSLEDPNIDYTDLILQLQRVLLKRNAEVLRRRTKSAPAQD